MLDFYVIDGHRRIRAVAAVARYAGNLVGHVLAFHDFSENSVPVIEVRRRSNGDEELAAVGIRTGIGHGQFAGLGML